jgi:hypothetical protein
MPPPRPILATVLLFVTAVPMAHAGGPRWTAGSAYFSSSVEGQPVLWQNGALVYYTDQGALSSYESNSAAAGLVAAAAAPWTQVATASVTITQGGVLAEDVSGANVSGSRGDVAWPADVESTAVPVAVVYDADGSVLNTVYGAGASSPSGCLTNAVTSISDGFSTGGYLTHAIILLNGLCAANATEVANMQYLLTREFGRVLGLDWSQANDNAWTGSPQPTANDFAGWPLMHPINLDCGTDSYDCVPNAFALRMDDRAALGRLYPAANFSSATIRIHGTITFSNGQGMQGIVVQATRLVTGTNTPDTSMVASCITGFSFQGNVGNAILGTTDSAGNPLARFGSAASGVEGKYDLAGLELPAGATTADYELTFSGLNPLYTGAHAEGPEILGSPAASGTLQTVIIRGLTAGVNYAESISVANSATATKGMWGSFAAPNAVPQNGAWASVLNGYGDTAWMTLSVRPNRQYSVLAVAENESGSPTQTKAMPVLGAWFAQDATGAPPDFSTSQAFNSSSEGTTILTVETPAGDGALDYPMQLAIADARGDGRPDYAYTARVLYADQLSPAVVPLSGAVLAITGMGFVSGDRVKVNGTSAAVLAASDGQLVVQVPPMPVGAYDVQVNDPSGAVAILFAALTYGTASDAALNVLSLPGGNSTASGPVGASAPGSFTVQAVDSNGNPVSGALVTFSAANGSQLSACAGQSVCQVSASSSGVVSTMLIPADAGVETLTASLSDGASAQTQWTATTGGEALQFGVNPLNVQSGVALSWPVTVTAVNRGQAIAGATVTFTVVRSGKTLATASKVTNVQGAASYTALLPGLASGASAQVTACLADGTCASVTATAESPSAPLLVAMAGTSQAIVPSATFAPVQWQVLDGAGVSAGLPGNPLAGATVTVSQTLYSYVAASDGKEPSAKVLATSTATLTSDANGMVVLQPLQQAAGAETAAGSVVLSASIGESAAQAWTLVINPGYPPVSGGPSQRRSRIL